jgi:EAL domain-containing protein (putative c-di-GMP-specific phosphodiesterase class I)
MTERLMRDALAGLAAVLPARDDFKIAVNISPMHFLKDGFAASLEKLCAAEGLKPSTLVIELTERQNLSDFAKAASVAQALRALGVRISIDDVGTGHNGLSTLQDMPSDIIKIDKRFVDTVIENPLSANIITMLTGLARQLGRITVAEGVETPGQILAVTACGVDEVQGYHYSKPVPADAFIAWCTAYAETLNASAVRGTSNRIHGAPPVRAVRKRA